MDNKRRSGASLLRYPHMGTGFYRRAGKRLADVFVSGLGLICLSPVLGAIAVAVKLGSRGAILFSQERVGMNGRLFRILKFRTMVSGADRMGLGITSAGDPRITPLGARLRRWKLDELPQLWNVLRGHMSMVGPRPELPCYLARCPQIAQKVIAVRPGLTAPASLRFVDEEDILSEAADKEKFYEETLLPQKMILDVQYVQSVSFLGDLQVMAKTLVAIACRHRRGRQWQGAAFGKSIVERMQI
jgi:lipopolysaccharide/colanic/teichoic acid biosynthesis glycosyltransferase